MIQAHLDPIEEIWALLMTHEPACPWTLWMERIALNPHQINKTQD